MSYYFSYAVSYLPASGDQFNGLTPGTAAAEPEKFVNKEVGVKWEITPRLTYTTALYELDRTNSRFPDPVNLGFLSAVFALAPLVVALRIGRLVDRRGELPFIYGGTVAMGIDNLNNQQTWNFHPYPQRSYAAELKVDL